MTPCSPMMVLVASGGGSFVGPGSIRSRSLARRRRPGCRHKHSYLQQISAQFAGAADPLARSFCVPEAAVRASARWERILFLLSVALMESLGIGVNVCIEPEYADVDGFVLLPGDHAVIATRVRADSAWHADVAGRGSAVRAFADVTGHAGAHSVTEAAPPGGRLAALAGYLGLDWPWLWRCCAGLGEHRRAGLVRPRSRLLSTEAVDAALRPRQVLGGLISEYCRAA